MNEKIPSFETLKTLSQPLIDILYEYYDPYSTIVINQTSVKIFNGGMGIPIEPKD